MLWGPLDELENIVKDPVTVDRQLHVAQQEAKLLQLALEVRADNKLQPPALLGRWPGFSEARNAVLSDILMPNF